MFSSMKKLRILACAFTCCPPGQPGFTGGEDLLGWNLIKQISKYHETWILTQGEDRASIEDTCQREPNSNLHFLYVDLPRWLRFLLKIKKSGAYALKSPKLFIRWLADQSRH